MADPYGALAEDFVRQYGRLRGVVRRELIARQLAEHLPPPPAYIVDVGGGAGHQSLPLARKGYEVTLLDHSASMRIRATERIAAEDAAVRSRVRIVAGTAEHGRRCSAPVAPMRCCVTAC